MANAWYNSGKVRSWAGSTGEVDWINDTLKIMALETLTGHDIDNEFIGDETGAGVVEVTSTGYTGGFGGAGRLTLGSKAIAVDDTNDRAEFDCADPTWSSISQATSETWSGFIVMKEITNDAASPVLLWIDTDSGGSISLTPNGSDILFSVNSEGLAHIT